MISDERIMGFVEGEGCFSVAIQRPIDYRPRKTERKNNRVVKASLGILVKPSFRVAVVEKDNYILYAIRKKLGVGEVYTAKRSKKVPDHQDHSQYYVQTFKDCLKARDFFKHRRFYTRKGEDFAKWSECLDLMEQNEHLTKDGLIKILKIKEKMNPRKNKGNRSFEELVKLIEEKPEYVVARMKKKEQILIHNPRARGSKKGEVKFFFS
ncbi:MAG: LAGLIDADG family homing endonuclease [archaeon]